MSGLEEMCNDSIERHKRQLNSSYAKFGLFMLNSGQSSGPKVVDFKWICILEDNSSDNYLKVLYK